MTYWAYWHFVFCTKGCVCVRFSFERNVKVSFSVLTFGSPFKKMKSVATTVFKYELAANGVLELVLNRPNKLNAMQPVFFEELDSLVSRAIDDEAVRVILVHGGDSKGFTAGLDLTAVGSVLPSSSSAAPEETTADKSAKVLYALGVFISSTLTI